MPLTICHWLISSQGKKSDISQFFSCLIDGHSLDAKSPILSARRKLMSLKAKNKRDPHRAAEIIIEAWNMERAAAKKKKYTPRKTSDINSFPPVES